MSSQTPRARRIFPPVYLALALALMTCLHQFVPGFQLIGSPLRYGGALLAAGALGLVLWTARLLAQSGTTLKPFQESSVLVLRGPYRFTRNPIYVGLTGILLGIGVLLGSGSPFFVVPLFVALIDRRVIRVEEEMLEATFGASYIDYKARVRRWL